ncbi:DNA-directed RNA polymerase subunit alpha [candidate division WWE3 bacterium CG_4_9_14_3_um_filter_41_6]|nr:MAG: DNA-directed RNA polymerase subunit alpha [candidate division WWE3 bacterium CG_4_9_14_3_um_filter_41_6]
MEIIEFSYNVEKDLGNNRQIVSVEPLARGFGHTLGNALRRALLSGLSGAAITKVKIEGASHEFSSLKGVIEDTVGLIQNLKGVNFMMNQPKVMIVSLSVSGEREVTAADFRCPTGVEVVNKDHHIATLTDKKSVLTMEITVEYGTGYRLPLDDDKKTVGTILLDANFSPIILGTYSVENTRVGRQTDLDKLVFDVTTNGSVSSEEAIKRASAILVEYFARLAGDAKVYAPKVKENVISQDDEADNTDISLYLEELNLPTRVLNTLKKSGYETISDLKNAGEDGLKNIKNIGPKTVQMVLDKVNNE